jgi:hypothetical protein
MGRLTTYDKKGEAWVDFLQIPNALNKLAHYEDLEEAGRLIEQKRGKWEPLDSYVCDSDCMWRCSECKVDLYFELGTPLEYEMYYCPNCGAKMLKELEGEKCR